MPDDTSPTPDATAHPPHKATASGLKDLRLTLRAVGAEAALLLELQSLRQLLPLPVGIDRAIAHLANLNLARTLADLCTPAARAVFVRNAPEGGEQALCAVILDHHNQLAPAAPKALRVGMTAAALAVWAHEHHVGHWLNAPAEAALPSAETPRWLLRGRSLAEIACPRPDRDDPGAVQQRAHAQVRALACLQLRSEAAILGAAGHAARAVGRIAPTEPALLGLYEAVQAQRTRLAGTLLPRPAAELSGARVGISSQPPGLTWRLTKSFENHCCAGPEVRLLRDESGQFGLSCSCEAQRDAGRQTGICEARIEAVERFSDLVSRPGRPTDRRRLRDLADALGAPAWRREVERFFDAAALDAALATTVGGQEARFVWRLHIVGGALRDIGPALAGPDPKGGLQLRTMRLAATAQTADDLPSDLDRDVLGLVMAARALHKRQDSAAAGLWRQAAERLVGAGNVVADDGPASPAQVQRQRIGVVLTRQGDRCVLTATLDGVAMAPDARAAVLDVLETDAGLHWDRSERCLEVLDASQRVRRALVALRDGGASFPLAAMTHLRERLAGVVEAAFTIAPSAQGSQVPTDARPRLRMSLRPARDGAQGLRIEARVRPLADGPSVTPGLGAAVAYAVHGSQPVHGLRDLQAERDGATALWRALSLPTAAPADFEAPPDSDTNPWTWLEDDADTALDLIARVAALCEAEKTADLADLAGRDALGPATVAPAEVTWQGDVERVVGRTQTNALRVSLVDKRDWFGLEGKLSHGAHTVPLQSLLEALRTGRRYVAVGEGDWLEISEQVRRQLLPIAVAAHDGRLSPLAAPALSALEEAGAHVAGPARWMRLHDRLRDAAALHVELPATLNAELRPYQRDGFAWLMRLTTWAPGAVLADDMGLGKTVQALALLLARAAEGPALVVMPTSVLDNWQREAARFAPTLVLRPLRNKDHLDALTDVAAGEVVLTTWELLTRHRDAITEQTWGTVVFDEAQALKNPATRRAKAAFAVEAGFRLALTGTPVENRTDELWSVLRAAVPGLLGGRRDFRARFAVPIERYGDPRVKATLAALIRPFVLRRMKAEVAKELPPRQDIRLDVDLDPGTRRMYDALRASLQASLGKAGREERAGRRIEVLAALTRLRQLACHPRLLDPQSPAPAAKVLALRGQLAELRAEGHQALVFSQFTSLLDLVRVDLESDGLRVLQLDGRTPGGRRQALVDTFQRGDADVFLLSVKAGGTGLNLTAASYVFHLDPWWNPAVEDQATDRAHRIGQVRPVTVYRVVARGTVEEAIYALHRDKRDLVNALLSGTGEARSLTVQELEALVVYSGKRTWEDQQPAHVRAMAAPEAASETG